MEHLEADVCVVGAGFAGLAAARHLREQGATVVVLEARDRVGGRVWDRTLEHGTVVSVGGTWLGVDHGRMFDLVGKVGLGVYPQYDDGEALLRLDGENLPFQDGVPRLGWWGLLWMGIAFGRLDEITRSAPPGKPWEAPRAREMDAETLGGWIGSAWNVPSRRARLMLRTSLGLLFSTDLAKVSLLGSTVLARGRREGFQYYLDAGLTETHLIDGGGPPEVARRLGVALGDSLRKSTPVRRIVHGDEHVRVEGDGVTVRAGHVIVTAPPVLAGRIEHDPPLPAPYTELMRQMPPGEIMRVITVYPTPFWRDAGLNGQSAAPQSPVAVSIDQSPPSPFAGAPPPRGILSSYAFGPHAVELARMDPSARRRLWLKELADRFGPPAGEPLEYGETDWSAEEWSLGGMISHFPPGVVTSVGSVLHQPHGRIHWAGTERATEMHGLMEGAVRSGEQAARDVLARLRAEAPAAAV